MLNARGLLRLTGKIVYVTLLMLTLAYGAWMQFETNTSFWFKMVTLPWRPTLVVVFSSMVAVWILDRIDEVLGRMTHPLLQWSVFSRNINFVPMDYVPLRVPFLVLLYFNLPVLAWIEEMIFRHDWVFGPTTNWTDALWRSALFGAAHLVGGAKMRSTIPLFLGGMWFSWHYFQGGVQHATLAHLAMNTAGLTLMLIAWARTGKNPFAA